MDFKMILSLVFSLIGIVIVLILTYYGSRWLARRYSTTSGSKHIKIIDRATIGQDKYIIVAEICNSKYIIGASGQQITLLKDLGQIELTEEIPNKTEDFSTIFSGMLKKQILQVKDRFGNKGERL